MPQESDKNLSTSSIENESAEQTHVLPRPAWNDQVAYFRVLFKIKKALDLAEQKLERGF